MAVALSIIIPMYNAEQYIEQAVNSAFSGVGEEVELIIVDDGSTDRSWQICQKMNDSRIRLFQQRNQGAPAARNLGLKNATGKYVLFFDADDFFADGAIAKILRDLNHSEHDCYIGNFYRYDGATSKIEYESIKSFTSVYDFYMYSPSPGNKVFKKSVLVNNNLIFSGLRLAQDLNFYMKFLGISQDVFVLDYPFAHYRYVPGSISRVIDDRILDMGKAIRIAIDYYDEHKAIQLCYSMCYLVGLKHLNYQLYKLNSMEDAAAAESLYVELINIWDDFYGKAKIMPFSLKYYLKKWVDTGLQFAYRRRVRKHLRSLRRELSA